MFIKGKIYILSLLATISCNSYAAETTAGTSLLVSGYRYEEPNLMSLDGTLLGIAADVTVKQDGLMLRVEGSYQHGGLDYNSVSTGSDDNVPNSIYEARALVGLDLWYNQMSWSTPYIGIGARRLVDRAEGTLTTTGHWGYNRTQDYVYIPLGIFLNKDLNTVSIKANFEYDYLVYGHNKSELGYVPGNEDLTFTQDEGYGLRAEVSFIFPMQQRTVSSIAISPYVNYWNIEKSNNVVSGSYVYWEPANTTHEVGLKLRFEF